MARPGSCGVSRRTRATILDQNISSFLKFIAHRYQANPVRQAKTESIPATESCPDCKQPINLRHRTNKVPPARILWHRQKCNKAAWRTYGEVSSREKKT